MNFPHTVDIVGNEMVVLDTDGNGCECSSLTGLRAAKRQLRQWQDEYAFDYARAMSAALGHFQKLSSQVQP